MTTAEIILQRAVRAGVTITMLEYPNLNAAPRSRVGDLADMLRQHKPEIWLHLTSTTWDERHALCWQLEQAGQTETSEYKVALTRCDRLAEDYGKALADHERAASGVTA